MNLDSFKANHDSSTGLPHPPAPSMSDGDSQLMQCGIGWRPSHQPNGISNGWAGLFSHLVSVHEYCWSTADSNQSECSNNRNKRVVFSNKTVNSEQHKFSWLSNKLSWFVSLCLILRPHSATCLVFHSLWETSFQFPDTPENPLSPRPAEPQQHSNWTTGLNWWRSSECKQGYDKICYVTG